MLEERVWTLLRRRKQPREEKRAVEGNGDALHAERAISGVVPCQRHLGVAASGELTERDQEKFDNDSAIRASDGPRPCAAGHGRSALFGAASLLHHRIANKASDAEAMFRHHRPGIRLNRGQRRLFGERAVATDE